MLTTSYQIDMTVKISRVVIGKEDKCMKKALRFAVNMLCATICAWGAGLWIVDAFDCIESKED